jgi:hypothetical protein
MVKRQRVMARLTRRRQNISLVFRGIFVLLYKILCNYRSWRYFDIFLIFKIIKVYSTHPRAWTVSTSFKQYLGHNLVDITDILTVSLDASSCSLSFGVACGSLRWSFDFFSLFFSLSWQVMYIIILFTF